jgi:acetylornithine/N-succinyldiaminopimelate aminotransferase
MGDEYFKQSFRPLLPDILMLEYNNSDQLSAITEKTAAVLIDPVQAESGATVPSFEFMKALRAQCTATGTLLIMDEAQTGFGRTAKLWAFSIFIANLIFYYWLKLLAEECH